MSWNYHLLPSQKICSQYFLVMFYQRCLCHKSDKTFKSLLKGNFAGVCHQIPGNAIIHFVSTQIERRILKQIHKYMVNFFRPWNQTLNNIQIIDNGQLVNFFPIVVQFFLPVELPTFFLAYRFQIIQRQTRNLCLEAVAGNRILYWICQSINYKIQRCLFFHLFHNTKVRVFVDISQNMFSFKQFPVFIPSVSTLCCLPANTIFLCANVPPPYRPTGRKRKCIITFWNYFCI